MKRHKQVSGVRKCLDCSQRISANKLLCARCAENRELKDRMKAAGLVTPDERLLIAEYR